MTAKQKARLLTRDEVGAPRLPERILQFGEGNFLRAFVDWMVQKMNERIAFNTGIVIVQPREKNKVLQLNAQDGLFTVRLTGMKNGAVTVEHDLVTCVNRGVNAYHDYHAFLEIARNPGLRFIVSNTTEAGVVYINSDRLEDHPPSSFPAKLTQVLYERYEHFGGDPDKALIILPTELIDRNGDALREIVLRYCTLWALPQAFCDWVGNSCTWCNSLVDRIVPGFPADSYTEVSAQLGYEDKLLVEGERFHLWVIQAPAIVEELFPAPEAGLNVIFTDDLDKYRKRKVRILNGAHTCMVPVGFLCGLTTVSQSIDDPEVGAYLEQLVYEEILPALDPRDQSLVTYARDTLDRFRNPYIKHYLMSIALNSISKFCTRVLPSLEDYVGRLGRVPLHMALALAALVRFYRGDLAGEKISLQDDPVAIQRMQSHWTAFQQEHGSMERLTRDILSDQGLWGQDLTLIKGLSAQVANDLETLNNDDPARELKNLISQISK